MKRIVFLLGMICITLGISAQTINSRSRITLKTAGEANRNVRLLLSDDFSNGWDNTWDANPAQDGGIYVFYQDAQYSIWASNEYSENLPLGFVSTSNLEYTLSFDLFLGTSYEIYDRVADQTITVNGSTADYNFTIDAADVEKAINDRFVINYVAPSCVTVRENLEIGRYYTICLPQDIVSFNGGTFWSMSKRGVGVAYLEGEDAPLTAGQPYIFQATAEELCVVYGNAVPAAEAGVAGALKGTFAAMGQAALSDAAADYNSPIYLLYHNELRPAAGAGNNLPANRAFIVYNLLDESEPNQAPGRRVRAIPMQTNGATAFENVDVEAAKAVKFMEDGKIFIKRGDAIYNLQGQIVK